MPQENGPKITEDGLMLPELSVFRKATDDRVQWPQPKFSEHLSNSDVPVTHIWALIRCDIVFPREGKFTVTILRVARSHCKFSSQPNIYCSKGHRFGIVSKPQKRKAWES